ncbi:hypothetical protein CsSME_00040125 [Camellia sinensis var. sinensis]
MGGIPEEEHRSASDQQSRLGGADHAHLCRSTEFLIFFFFFLTKKTACKRVFSAICNG